MSDGNRRTPGRTTLLTRTLSCVLTLSLALFLTPAGAWADSPSSGGTPQNAGDSSTTVATDSPASDTSTIGATSDDVAPDTAESDDETSVDKVSTGLIAGDSVSIQDAEVSGQNFDGTLIVGTTLWANVYDGEGLSTSSTTLTYQWYVGDDPSASIDSYQPLEGQIGRSLTLDEALANRIAGKNLRVQVSDPDGSILYSSDSTIAEIVSSDSISDSEEQVLSTTALEASPLTLMPQSTTGTVSVSVIGPDASGADGYWASSTKETVSSTDTAWDASKAAFDSAGLTYDAPSSSYGVYLASITSPYTNSALGYDAASGKYWQLFINGEAATTGASSISLHDGDSIVWYYSAFNASLPVISTNSVSVSVIGPGANGSDSCWVDSTQETVSSTDTAWDASRAAFNGAGLTYDAPSSSYGVYLASITSPYTNSALGYDATSGKYWQLFINGEAATTGASSISLHDGDSIVWYYSAFNASLPVISTNSVSVSVIGPGSSTSNTYWVNPTHGSIIAGESCWDASKAAFDGAGLTYDAPISSYGVYLASITSPYTNSALGYDATSGKYWQLFINGEAATTGASSISLNAGDSVVWCYSTYGASLPDTSAASVSVSVIGPDASGADGYWVNPTKETVISGENCWDASKAAFDGAGLTYDAPISSYGVYLASITSPYTNSALGYDATSGKYWQLFINGEAATTGASSISLNAGDSVVWCYSTYGASLPDTSIVYDDPNTPLPGYTADWPSYRNNGSTTNAATPTTALKTDWAFDCKGNVMYVYASEPLIVDGKVYLAVDSTLYCLDANTGALLGTGKLGAKIDYTSRPVYTAGMVIVSLTGGRVQALNAQTLKTRWITDMTDNSVQTSCTLSVSDGVVYVGAAAITGDVNNPYASGWVKAIDISTGTVKWTSADSTAGYYWSGALESGDDIVVGDTSGIVRVLDRSTGQTISSLKVGSSITADPVAYGDDVIVVTRDGYLHKLAVSSNGQITELGSVYVGQVGKAAPTVCGDTALIGGMTQDGSASLLVLVDLRNMSVSRSISTADGNTISSGLSGISATALVSTQSTGTYVYFTVNDCSITHNVKTSGGGLYLYRIGDAEAMLLFMGTGDYADYCDSPVICDGSGNLYYLNDSGHLIRLKVGGSNSGTDSGTDTHTDTGSSDGTVSSTAVGTVAPSYSTVSPSQTALTTAEDTSTTASTAGVTNRGTGSTSSSDEGVTSDDVPLYSGTLNIWPYIGLGVGICGLGGLLWWLIAARRRRESEEGE